jgi:hypothetical protein
MNIRVDLSYRNALLISWYPKILSVAFSYSFYVLRKVTLCNAFDKSSGQDEENQNK